MLKPSYILLGILVIALAGCATCEKGTCSCSSCKTDCAQTCEKSCEKSCKKACTCEQACSCKQTEAKAALDAAAYSTTQAIIVDGERKGFLCTYEELPDTAGVKRDAPAGTAFIQDLDFNNLGFISPKGELWRFGPGNRPEKVHQAEIIENLAVFYGVSERQVSLENL
jgi:hypothetical protein